MIEIPILKSQLITREVSVSDLFRANLVHPASNAILSTEQQKWDALRVVCGYANIDPLLVVDYRYDSMGGWRITYVELPPRHVMVTEDWADAHKDLEKPLEQVLDAMDIYQGPAQPLSLRAKAHAALKMAKSAPKRTL